MTAKNKVLVKQVQEQLQTLGYGYELGLADGSNFGARMVTALENFQLANGLPATGSIDRKTLEALGLPATGSIDRKTLDPLRLADAPKSVPLQSSHAPVNRPILPDPTW